MPKQRNARFWIWWNDDWVKITLRPGQEITLYCGGPTDEGWSHHSETYEYDDSENIVVCLATTDGCDCDGRLTTHNDTFCRLDELQGVPEEACTEWRAIGSQCVLVETGEVMPPRPRWERLQSYQRDYEAEKAGY